MRTAKAYYFMDTIGSNLDSNDFASTPLARGLARMIFISYRRDDSIEVVGRMYDRLIDHFPVDKIFRDLDSISPGETFPDVIRAKLSESCVALVVIGTQWLQILHERKNESVDHVRDEIRLALESGIVVIPITVSNAKMPTEIDLAEFPILQPLALIHGMSVRPDPDFSRDLQRLMEQLSRLPGMQRSLAQQVSAELLSGALPESHRHLAIDEVEEQLQQFFGSEKTTLIVDGLPGAGKTTLLKRVAREHDGFYLRLNDLTEGEDWWKRGDLAIARSDGKFHDDFPTFVKLLAGRQNEVVLCLDGLERTRDATLFARRISEDRPSFPPNVKFVLGLRRNAVSAEVDRQLAGLKAQVIELPVLRDGVLDRFLSAFDVPTALPMAMRRSLTTPFLVSVVAQAGAAESVENASLAIRSAFDDAVGANSAKQVFLHAFSRVLVNRDSYSPIPASDVISAAEHRLSASDCDVETHGSLCSKFYDRGLIIDDGKGLATTHDRLTEYLVAVELVRELTQDGPAAVANRLLDATPDGLLWASTDF